MSGLPTPFLAPTLPGIGDPGGTCAMRQTLTARMSGTAGRHYLEATQHYLDDWHVTSNTLIVGLSHHFGPRCLVYGAYRRYDQTGAYFYQPQYTGSPTYYTADFRLEPFASNNYTGKIVMTPAGKLWWLPGGTGLMLQYERYQANNGFSAGILSTGLHVPLKIK
jgi:hypothetical protein